MNGFEGFSIGPVRIDRPVFLAPMSGVSDLPFRRMVKRFGAGLVFSEMIASRPAVEECRRNRKKHFYGDEFPIAVQLAGCEPDMVAEAARIHEAQGASIIDINFGCPVKKIVTNFAGSALMKDIPLAAQIIAETVRAVNIPVTVKMRLGWDEHMMNAPELARIAQDLGAKMVTVHGRTRCQLYNGKADWAAIRAVRDVLSIPLIANGDIMNAADARRAMELSGADGVMVGRATYGRPWLVRDIMDALSKRPVRPMPTRAEIGALVLDHYDMMIEHYGARIGVPLARKHIGWYCAGFEGAETFRTAVNKLSDPEQVQDHIRVFFCGEGSAALAQAA